MKLHTLSLTYASFFVAGITTATTATTTTTTTATTTTTTSLASFINIQRPESDSTWARTKCSSPSGSSPAEPAGPYTTDMDISGNDMATCGSLGCQMKKTDTHLDCELKCNQTTDCAAYVWADANCSSGGVPICWTKSSVSKPEKRACRNYRILAKNATERADIPSRWATEVNATSTPLPAYPRPQMVRGGSSDRDVGDPSTWLNLNGLWEWQPWNNDVQNPPFGKTLNGSILVPFPVESCLSGVAPQSSDEIVENMFYRLNFYTKDLPQSDNGRLLLHFGAIDWQSEVFLNGKSLGNHTGGYDGFSFDITNEVNNHDSNELLVYAHDPSDSGHQPNGKQRISAISSPGGDTYTPSSGIWQTVWLETVAETYVQDMYINQASLTQVEVSVDLIGSKATVTSVKYEVLDSDAKTVLASAIGTNGQVVTIKVPSPKLWSPDSPYLYDLRITAGNDAVMAYFGLRTFVLDSSSGKMRPMLNSKPIFLAGFLDQSFWPDGQYTAPTDEALAYDIEAVPMFGLNMIRLHQKVNPERWYYHADSIGVVLFQDMVQKYGGASSETVPLFVNDLRALIAGRKNHPCIVQFTTFNEGDCWNVFKEKPYDVPGIVALAQQLAPNHLIDTDSGGGANNLHIGNVNDIHSYPYPGDPQPSRTQYAMVGEFGGIGAFVEGKEWKPKACHTYLHTDTPTEEADTYVKMAATLQNRSDHISASVYTQTTDVELECDGFLNYDRSNKFSEADTANIKAANQALIKSVFA